MRPAMGRTNSQPVTITVEDDGGASRGQLCLTVRQCHARGGRRPGHGDGERRPDSREHGLGVRSWGRRGGRERVDRPGDGRSPCRRRRWGPLSTAGSGWGIAALRRGAGRRGRRRRPGCRGGKLWRSQPSSGSTRPARRTDARASMSTADRNWQPKTRPSIWRTWTAMATWMRSLAEVVGRRGLQRVAEPGRRPGRRRGRLCPAAHLYLCQRLGRIPGRGRPRRRRRPGCLWGQQSRFRAAPHGLDQPGRRPGWHAGRTGRQRASPDQARQWQLRGRIGRPGRRRRPGCAGRRNQL